MPTPTWDQIASILAPRFVAPSDYDVRRFGAIWDGASHPLSERYGTLGAAQAVYPHASALTDEIDWCATQGAINQAVLSWSGRVSGTLFAGATVRMPSGEGRFNRQITLPYRGIDAVQTAPAVSMAGQGREATGLVWDTAVDAISGAAIVFRRAVVTGGVVSWAAAESDSTEMADVTLTDFHMLGPGYFWGYAAPTSQADFIAKYGFDAGAGWATAYNTSNPRIGQVRGNYDGIELPDRVSLRNVQITGFRAGLSIRGGQRLLELVRIVNCYWGILLGRNSAHHGDFTLLKCDISGRMACVGIKPEATWFATAITTIFNQSPYVFYKLASDPAQSGTDAAAIAYYGSHWPGLVRFSSFHNCQFESIGNTIIADGNTTRRHLVSDVDVVTCSGVEAINCSFPATALHIIGDVAQTAFIIDTKQVRGFRLETPVDPGTWGQTRHSFGFRVTGTFEASHVEGVTDLIGRFTGANRQLFSVGGALRGGEITLVGNDWRGCVLKTSEAGAANKSIVAKTLLGICENLLELHTAARPGIVGVAQEANNNTAQSNAICVALPDSAALTILKETGATSSSGAGLTVSATWSLTEPGRIREAAGDEVVIGRTIGTGASGAWGEWHVRLMDLQPAPVETKELTFAVALSDQSVVVADGKSGVAVPASLAGMNIVGVTATVYTQGVTGSTTIQVRRRRGATNVDVLSSALSIGAVYTATSTAINAANDDLTLGDTLFVDVDSVHTTAPIGLWVTVTARR